MTEITKEKIKKILTQYVQMFPVEYEEFMQAQRVRQGNKINKYADFKGSDQIVRHLIEIPESLNLALRMKLEQEEFDWLFGFNEYEGKYNGFAWFMKMFPQFKITEDF